MFLIISFCLRGKRDDQILPPRTEQVEELGYRVDTLVTTYTQCMVTTQADFICPRGNVCYCCRAHLSKSSHPKSYPQLLTITSNRVQTLKLFICFWGQFFCCRIPRAGNRSQNLPAETGLITKPLGILFSRMRVDGSKRCVVPLRPSLQQHILFQ